MSSSESEDDFLSADEGSDDNELPCNLKNKEKMPDLSGKVSDSPEKVSDSPEKVAYSPEKVPDSPVKVPDSPVKVPDSPVKVPDSPVKVPDSPVKVPDSPVKVPDSPVKVPDSPVKVPDSPVKVPDSPEKVPDSPVKVPDSPEKVPDSPEKVPDSPEKVAYSPEKVADSPEKVADSPEKVADSPEKVADSPEKVPDSPEKVPDSPEKVPDLPKKNDEKPKKKPDQENECKGHIKYENDSHLDSRSTLEMKISSKNLSDLKSSTEEQPILKETSSTSEEEFDHIEKEEKSLEVEKKFDERVSDQYVKEPEMEEIKQDKYEDKSTKSQGELKKHDIQKDNLEKTSSNENENIDKTKDKDSNDNKSSRIVSDKKDKSFTSKKVCSDEMTKDSVGTSNITDIYCLNPNEEDSITVDSAKKPRRVSKIGAKKPREKLGERKKLGTKIARPLDSVSCDDRRELQEQKDEPKRKESLASFGSWEKINSLDAAAVDAKSEDDASGWSSGWGDWGSSLVSAASTLKQEVSKGVGSVVEMVEEGISIPSPEELAREQVERDRWINRLTEENSDNSLVTPSPPPETASFGLNLGGFTSLVSGVSDVGSKVMMGGLDTLELIGRKTMTVLQDTDPNIRYKKEQLLAKVNKPNLSSVLREAREFAESNPSPTDSDSPSSPSRRGSHRITYQQLWDNSTGPAHLEALALIARQSSANTKDLMNSLPAGSRQKADALNRKLKELSELEEENLAEGAVFSEQVTATIKLLKLPLNADNIAQCWTDLSTLSSQYVEGSDVLRDTVALDASTVEANLLGSCVSLVERIVSVAHKAAEICLSDITAVNALELAINYKELAVLGGSHLDCCTDTVCTGLSTTEQYEKLSPLITNIYMQVCEGTSCLQQSLVHLCTTLQLVQVQQMKDSL